MLLCSCHVKNCFWALHRFFEEVLCFLSGFKKGFLFFRAPLASIDSSILSCSHMKLSSILIALWTCEYQLCEPICFPHPASTALSLPFDPGVLSAWKMLWGSSVLKPQSHRGVDNIDWHGKGCKGFSHKLVIQSRTPQNNRNPKPVKKTVLKVKNRTFALCTPWY